MEYGIPKFAFLGVNTVSVNELELQVIHRYHESLKRRFVRFLLPELFVWALPRGLVQNLKSICEPSHPIGHAAAIH